MISLSQTGREKTEQERWVIRSCIETQPMCSRDEKWCWDWNWNRWECVKDMDTDRRWEWIGARRRAPRDKIPRIDRRMCEQALDRWLADVTMWTPPGGDIVSESVNSKTCQEGYREEVVCAVRLRFSHFFATKITDFVVVFSKNLQGISAGCFPLSKPHLNSSYRPRLKYLFISLRVTTFRDPTSTYWWCGLCFGKVMLNELFCL